MNFFKTIKKLFANFGYDFVKVTGFIPAFIWLRPKVYYYGKKGKYTPKGATLIVSNHISFIDPILLLCVFWKRRVFSLVTKDLYKNKLMTFFLNAVRCIQVDKDNFSIKSFHNVVDKLKTGNAVLVFPEGQINNTNNSLMSFKSGAVLMAHSSRAKIVPVYINREKRNIAVIGDPVDIREMCGDMPDMNRLKTASDYLQEREKELEQFYINCIKSNNEGK